MQILSKGIRKMALGILMLCLLSGLGVCKTTVIDFENAQKYIDEHNIAVGFLPGDYHQLHWAYLDDQYSDLGVKFNHVSVIDFTHFWENYYPNFPRSGKFAVEKSNALKLTGYPSGDDCNPIEISLPQVYRIKVWVGIDYRNWESGSRDNIVTMSAYDSNGNPAGETSATITQTYHIANRAKAYTPTQILTPLEIKYNYQPIAKVIISLNGCSRALAIDDVEFDTSDYQPLMGNHLTSYAGGNPYESHYNGPLNYRGVPSKPPIQTRM